MIKKTKQEYKDILNRIGVTYSEKEVFEFELQQLRNSDVVIFQETGVRTMGSAYEIGVAHELHKPIFILNEGGFEVHPWIEESANKVFTDREDLVDYLNVYYEVY